MNNDKETLPWNVFFPWRKDEYVKLPYFKGNIEYQTTRVYDMETLKIETILVPTIIANDSDFVILATDDSNETKIMKNSKILAKKQSEVFNENDFMIVNHPEYGTLCRQVVENGSNKFILKAYNPEYPDIEANKDELHIIARVQAFCLEV